jgi:hypothetical protein
LNLTAPQVFIAEGWATAFELAIEFADSCKQTNQAVTQWKDDVLNGATNVPIHTPPTFPVGTQPAGNQGIVKQLFEFREQILVNPGFTDAIGEELGFLGPEIGPTPEVEAQPSLKVVAEVNYGIRVSGSMQGYAQMRVEWRKSGTPTWQLVTFVTNLPADVIVSPTTDGQPESGELRAIFYQKNQPVGVYSPNYPLTVSS